MSGTKLATMSVPYKKLTSRMLFLFLFLAKYLGGEIVRGLYPPVEYGGEGKLVTFSAIDQACPEDHRVKV